MTGMIIAIASQKGGVGKSTLARLIAREYAQAKWNVKIADLDILYDYSKWKPDCFAMNKSEEVNTTALNGSLYTKANRTGPSFVCETK